MKWTGLVAVAAAYFVAGKLGLQNFAFLHANASPLWAPAGIAVAALLLLGRGLWPAIFVAAFLVNVTTAGSVATSLVIAAGNTAAGVLGALLVARWAAGARAFERAWNVFKFVAIGALTAGVSATVGALDLALAGFLGPARVGPVWATWWLGDLAGILVVAPPLLLWRRAEPWRRLRGRVLEAAVLLATVLVAGQIVFGGFAPFASQTYPLAFLGIPPLVWASFRFGPPGASLAMLVSCALAVTGTLRGTGPFAVGSPSDSLLILGMFMVVMSATVLPVAALVWDRQGVERERAVLLSRAQAAQVESEERRRIAEELAGVARSLAETVDVEAVGRRVAEVVLTVFDARTSSLRLLTGDGSLIGVAFGGGMKEVYAPGHLLPGGPASVAGLAIAQRAAAWSEDVFSDARLDMDAEARRGMTEAGDAAVLAVPLRAKGQTIGALCITDRRGRRFTSSEADVLQAFADQAAAAVENARLFEEAMAQRRESDVIAALAADINSALDVGRVLQRVAESVLALCDADVSRIALRDDGGGTMSFRIGVGALEADRAQPDVRVEPGRGIGGYVMATGRPHRSTDVRDDPQGDPAFQAMIDGATTRSLLIVPIHGDAGVEGLICATRHSVRPFTEREEMVCQRLAAHAAIAIRNSHLFAAERTARAEAHAANRAKDHFLATLSHELRTPLNAMLGWLRMMRNPRLDEAQRLRAVEVIERNVRLQTQLINDLLDVSRIIAGKLELEAFALDLVPVVQEGIEAVRADVEAKGLRLGVELDPATGEVKGDPLRLQQVVTNLLSNAVKFTPPGGRLEVRLARVAGHARLTVADSGEGIEPEVLLHIFEPFQQADSSTRRAHQGLGLGLAIVRQLVDAHGGRVHAESPGKGQGATFIVELPITPLRSPHRRSPEAAPGGSRLDGLRVLVVDDETDAREAVGVVLRERGAEVHLAGSAAEALDLLRRTAIDVLVSDLAMPGADGYDLIRAVRSDHPGRVGPIRAVALTAYTGQEVRERTLAAGFAAHATKPLDPEDLVELIAKLPRL